jgi:hypothetical protein
VLIHAVYELGGLYLDWDVRDIKPRGSPRSRMWSAMALITAAVSRRRTDLMGGARWGMGYG